MKKIHKWAVALAIALLAVGGHVTAQAATKTKAKDLPLYTTYVRTKHAMDIGAKEKTKTGYKPIHVKKNKLLRVDGIVFYGKYPNVYTKATLILGPIHYARYHRIKYSNKLIRFNTANFTYVKTLRAPIRTQLLRQGKGFVMSTTQFNQPTYSAALYVTLDNYIQTYTKARMTQIDDNWLTRNVYNDFAEQKPTDSVKITKLVKKGTSYKIDYRTPLKGFADRKIGPHHYRLTIKQGSKQSQGYTPVDDTYDTAASWTNFKVNGRAYFSGDAEWGLN